MNRSYLCIEKSKQQLASLGDVRSRAQFGGYSLSVERTVFALINDGLLYLRASEPIQQYFRQHQAKPFIFSKRGGDVCLNYYQVEADLWQQPNLLLELSRSALVAAQHDRADKLQNIRLKNLPNLDFRLEASLRQAGIDSVEKLRDLGAEQCWVRLWQQNTHFGLSTLYALQGAICGQHQAVLASDVRERLAEWYKSYLQAHDGSYKLVSLISIPTS